MPYIQIQKQYSQTLRKLNIVNSFNRAYHTLIIFFTCIYYLKKRYKKKKNDEDNLKIFMKT